LNWRRKPARKLAVPNQFRFAITKTFNHTATVSRENIFVKRIYSNLFVLQAIDGIVCRKVLRVNILRIFTNSNTPAGHY
jgi:hypothetical protein